MRKDKLHLDAGALDTLVSLHINQSAPDGCGGFTDDWQLAGLAWAQIMAGTNNDEIIGDRAVNTNTQTIDVRQPLDVAVGAQFRIENSTRKFEVLSRFDPDETGRYWRCICKEIDG